jgi:hypothetical protein
MLNITKISSQKMQEGWIWTEIISEAKKCRHYRKKFHSSI